MNAENKAQELRSKYIELFRDILGVWIDENEANECAKITVNEIIANTDMYIGNLNPKWSFWQEVKQELEKM